MLPLDIRRETDSIRGRNGLNWHAEAFRKIQDFADALVSSVAPTPTPTPTPNPPITPATPSGGNTPFKFQVNGQVITAANLQTLPPPTSGLMSVFWLLDATLPVPNVSGNVRNWGGVDARTTITETVDLASQGELVTFDNAGAVTVTLDSSAPSTFYFSTVNLGAGTATLTPSSGNINGVASVAITTGSGAIVFFDGTNWWALTTGGSSGPTFADAETPADSGDHQHFTLATAPSPAGSLQLILKGTGYFNQPLFPAGGDYTLAGNAIALNVALVGSFTLLAWYRH